MPQVGVLQSKDVDDEAVREARLDKFRYHHVILNLLTVKGHQLIVRTVLNWEPSSWQLTPPRDWFHERDRWAGEGMHSDRAYIFRTHADDVTESKFGSNADSSYVHIPLKFNMLMATYRSIPVICTMYV